jgi:hypothetical protein
MTYDQDANALYIFGGATGRSTFSSMTDQTWRLSGGSWQELNSESSPSERGSPALGYDPARQRMVLYGGFDAAKDNLADTWEWGGQNWTCLLNCQ